MNTNVEVKLPVTGFTVVLKPFLTIGQSRELQSMLFEEGEFDVDAGKFTKMNPNAFLKMQDKAVGFLVQEIKDSAGVVVAYAQEWFNSLPVDDGNLLYAKVSEMTNASKLTEEAKKK
jgi:hypothetical protein